jgi:hypothetical protein
MNEMTPSGVKDFITGKAATLPFLILTRAFQWLKKAEATFHLLKRKKIRLSYLVKITHQLHC